MQTDARVGVVVEGGQRALNTAAAGSVAAVEGAAACKLSKQQRKSFKRQSDIGTVSQLLAGGVAGALSKTCTAPLARLTILFQIEGMHASAGKLSKPSIYREASRIIREEGIRAFWKGNLVTIAHRLPYSSVNFYAYEQYKKLLRMIPGLESHRENMGGDLFVHFLGGGLAGITAATATYPLDLVRTRLTAQKKVIYYRGIWHALRTISREEGILGLYKGLGATLLGVGPSIAISFSVYETLRSSWQTQRPQDSPVVVSLACGSLSGIASSTATFPIDLVRRRKQLEGAAGSTHVYKTGLVGMFKQIVKKDGFRGLYRGILPEYYKVVPSVGICFMTYESLKMLLAEAAVGF